MHLNGNLNGNLFGAKPPPFAPAAPTRHRRDQTNNAKEF